MDVKLNYLNIKKKVFQVHYVQLRCLTTLCHKLPNYLLRKPIEYSWCKSWNWQKTLTAFSFLFCLIMLDRTLARDCPSLSRRYAGTAPSGVLSSFFCLVFLCSCILMLQVDEMELVHFCGVWLGMIMWLCTHVFFICIFSACLCLWYILAFRPINFLALCERSWASRLSFFLFFSWWSRR